MLSLNNTGKKLGSYLLLYLITVSLNSMAQADFDDVEIEILHVQGNVYMLVGAGGNITLQVGEQGILMVDTMYEPLADKIYNAIREIDSGPITYIINTHGHPDHIGGNSQLAQRGSNIAGGNTIDLFAGTGNQAKVVSHENVLNAILSMSEQPPIEGWPTDTYFTERKDIYFNGEAIVISHQPNAHTDGDSFVFFRRSDVISSGDIFNTTGYPYIDVANGGTLQGILDGLNNLLDMAVPADRQEGGTMIIPGHGRLTDEADVLDYRDMLTIIRDRIAYRIDQGDSLEEVMASQPTSDYDPRYGSDSGFWTTDQFIETVYNELSIQ
tara:strand:+ start:68461 stop:69435 length:975 start_codon:yes stop_codon:yes gene_type:complete